MYLPAASVVFLLLDETGSSSRLTLHCSASIEGLDALGAAQSLIPSMSAVSDCVCTQINVIYTARFFPDEDSAGPGEPRAALLWSCEGDDQYAATVLPGINEELIQQPPDGDGISIDTNDTNVKALTDAIKTGIWCNPFGYDINILEAAYIQNRDR